jgi:hypothetical protein
VTLTPATSTTTAAVFSGVRCLLGTPTLNSGDDIAWASVDYDTDDYAGGVATPTDLVMPADGKYDLQYWVYDAAGDMIGVNAVLNRAGAASNLAIFAGNTKSAAGAITAALVAGDTVSLRYFGASPSTLGAGAIALTRVG